MQKKYDDVGMTWNEGQHKIESAGKLQWRPHTAVGVKRNK